MSSVKEYISVEDLFLDVEIYGMKKNYNHEQMIGCLLKRLRTDCMRIRVYEEFKSQISHDMKPKEKYEVLKAIIVELFPQFYQKKGKFDVFMDRKLIPGETISDFAHTLRESLKRANPDIPIETLDDLTKQRLLYSLPKSVSNIILMNGDRPLGDIIKSAQILNPVSNTNQCAAVNNEVAELISLFKEFLNTNPNHSNRPGFKSNVRKPVICWNCDKEGHLSQNCRLKRDQQRRYVAAVDGHTTTVSIDGKK